MKNFIKRIGIATSIGFLITTICMWIFGAYEDSGMEVLRVFTVFWFASALYGIINLIYDTNVPFPWTVIIHFVSCFAVTIAAGIASGLLEILGWFNMITGITPTFIIIYAIIGVISIIITKRQERQINNKIKTLDKQD